MRLQYDSASQKSCGKIHHKTAVNNHHSFFFFEAVVLQSISIFFSLDH